MSRGRLERWPAAKIGCPTKLAGDLAKMEEVARVNPFSNLTTAISLALDSIRAHKLRSFLTLLGVIIGVASVILVGSAIDGLGVYAEQSTAKAFGTESYLIAQVAQVGNMSRREYFDRLRSNRPITLDEFRFLRTVNQDNSIYSPYRQNTVDF